MSATLDKFYPGTHGNARRAKSKKIRDWLKLRFQVEEIGQSSRSKLRKARAKGVGASLSPETEDNIVQWVKDMRDDRIPVTTIMLQSKARDLAQEQGISTDQFKASKDWANSFRNRHGFTLRQKTRQGQDKEDGAQIELEKFSDRVRTIMRTHNIKKVFNADQTGMNYEYLPKTTVHPRGAKTLCASMRIMKIERTATDRGDAGPYRQSGLVVKPALPALSRTTCACRRYSASTYRSDPLGARMVGTSRQWHK
ncbi:Aste57867_2123 [Aphanomyces stellatus]|uniref:Aste57867_2123 protein n=1 Tax=Aphanomyces stellatus TaxID=120398 RepID=A0A485K7G6_9STRA|nr:hypothetical protein As57867_002118 [Aphanomyces stellatus]VFT79326.1 Aste57867_2123 [Aphanomyces stellatus]